MTKMEETGDGLAKLKAEIKYTPSGEWESPCRNFFKRVGLPIPETLHDSDYLQKKWLPVTTRFPVTGSVARVTEILETESMMLSQISMNEELTEQFAENFSLGAYIRAYFPALIEVCNNPANSEEPKSEK